MATVAVDSLPLTVPTFGECVICLAPNPTINQALFDCNHQAAFCPPCHYRAAIHLERCPLCRSKRKLVLPRKLHLTELVNSIDRTTPQVSYRFLSELSYLLVKKVERIYNRMLPSGSILEAAATGSEDEVTPTLRLPNLGGHLRSWSDTAAEGFLPGDGDLTTAAHVLQEPMLHGWLLPGTTGADQLTHLERINGDICQHPALTVVPCNKPLRQPADFLYPVSRLSLLLYVNWLNFTFMGDRSDTGPLQSWMESNGFLALTDSPSAPQTQRQWALGLVYEQLNVLNTNAINVVSALRWRESTTVCASPESEGIYGYCDRNMHVGYLNIRHMLGPYCPIRSPSSMATIDFGIPLTRSGAHIAGPYAFVFDLHSLLEHMGRLYPSPDTPLCPSPSVAISMLPDCYNLTQVLRHPSLGDTCLKVVRFFNAKGLRRVVYRLACKRSLVATAMRVCGNIFPGRSNENKSGQAKEVDRSLLLNEPNNTNLNFEKTANEDEDSILLSSNVSLMDVELVASNPDTYIYKVASVTPVFTGPLNEKDVLDGRRDKVSFPLAIVKLWVSPQAKIAISPSDSKVRVSSAKVVAIVPLLKLENGVATPQYSMERASPELRSDNNTNVRISYGYGKEINEAYNFFHQPGTMTYRVGNVVTASDFTNDLEAVCVPGIHGFTLQSEAIGYGVCMNPDKVDIEDIDSGCWKALNGLTQQKVE
jgi:hypothetical protein